LTWEGITGQLQEACISGRFQSQPATAVQQCLKGSERLLKENVVIGATQKQTQRCEEGSPAIREHTAASFLGCSQWAFDCATLCWSCGIENWSAIGYHDIGPRSSLIACIQEQAIQGAHNGKETLHGQRYDEGWLHRRRLSLAHELQKP
jgi:hypothetical protein